MAQSSLRLSHNAPGDFFVDTSCIDCDTCRWMAPDTFVRRQGQSSVHSQPEGDEERQRALKALVSCPTSSIGTLKKHDMEPVTRALPEHIENDVYHCGYHSESSFGAASYLIRRDRGNILVDSPRFTRPLVRRLEDMGGVATMFLTHQDDVADHEKFHDHFGCERILHESDMGRSTRDIERPVQGQEPLSLDDGVLLIPVPGHTKGSTCLLYREKFLFTGDHLAWSESLGQVYAFRGACWYSWSRLVASTDRLAEHRFEWILPGHGRRCRFPKDEMRRQMAKAIEWMKTKS